MIDVLDILEPSNAHLLPWVLSLLGIPLLSFLLSLLAGKHAPGLSTLLIFTNLLVAVTLTYQFWLTDVSIRGDWFASADRHFTYAFYFDKLTLIMLILVNFIGLLVHVFSIEYMRKDPCISRYFAYLGLFLFSMLLIVLSHDLLLMFVGWELVGLTSYLLIGFWWKKRKATTAANKAFIMNRVGDLGFLTGLMILFAQFQSFDLETIKSLMIFSEIEQGQWVTNYLYGGVEIVKSADGRWLSAAGIALFCGAVGKSAQFPLQVWLPDAMEGPTPVSALIHAATMVAAGVYMLARVFVLLDAQALEVVAIIGAVTAFMAAIAALSQFDIKKVLAYSTISQLGYMVMAMGVGAYTASLFHLITHAFFKAGLFLTAGIIIHQLHKVESNKVSFDPQDMRVMGGLRKQMPYTFAAFLFCAMALVGLPGFTGFLSKDAILLNVAVWADIKGGGFYIPEVLAFMTVVFTSFYTFRMVFLVFFGENRLKRILGNGQITSQIKEGGRILLIPAVLLGVLSMSWALGLGFDAQDNWLVRALPTPIYLVPISYAAQSLVDVPDDVFKYLHPLVLSISVALALAGIIIAYFAFKPGAKMERRFTERREPVGALGQISFYHWYQDALYQKLFVQLVIWKSKGFYWVDRHLIDAFVVRLGQLQVIIAHVTKWFDKQIVDGIVHTLTIMVGRIGKVGRSMQTGNIQSQVMLSFLFLILLILIFAF